MGEESPLRMAIRVLREGIQDTLAKVREQRTGVSEAVEDARQSVSPWASSAWSTFHFYRKTYPMPLVAGTTAAVALLSSPWGHGVTARNAVLGALVATALTSPELVAELAGFRPGHDQ